MESENRGPAPGDDPQAIVRIAHTIIQQAIQEDAEVIRVEPQPNNVTILFRIDSVIEEKMKLPAKFRQPLIARYKQMADMVIDQEDQPQQGRIAISHAGRDYDLDVRSEPSPDGERIVIAIRQRS